MAISAGTAALIGGGLAFGGSMLAADAQEDAARRSAATQLELGNRGLDFQERAFDIGRVFTEESYDTARADTAPYRATGTAALGTLNRLFIPGGQNVVALHGKLNELRALRGQMMGQQRRDERLNQLRPQPPAENTPAVGPDQPLPLWAQKNPHARWEGKGIRLDAPGR